MSRRLLVVLLAVTLVAAACGDDDTDAEDNGEVPAEEGARETDGTRTLEREDLLAGLDDCTEPSGDDPLVIGFAADLSELGGNSDQPASQAAEFMAEVINCRGGAAGGTPVEVIVKNIEGDPATTQRAAQELLDDGVHAILGPPFSDFGFPLLTVVDGQAPVLFVASTEVTLASDEAKSFLIAFSDPVQAAAAAEFAIDEGHESAVTFSSPDAPYFDNLPMWFTEVFEQGGGQTVRNFTFSLDDEDFSTQVNQLASLDPLPDVLYTAMVMPQSGVLLGQLRGAGVLDDIHIIGADSFDATEIVAAGDVADGVEFTTHAFPDEGTQMQEFLDLYEEEQGSQLETVSFGALGADGVLLVVDAFERVGELNPDAIYEALRSAEDVEVITGTVSYEGGENIPDKPVFILALENGETTLVDRFTPENVPEG
jgi:branched-chain amino acid transport system substrate-binding protein